jgi:hypothetical protein
VIRGAVDLRPRRGEPGWTCGAEDHLEPPVVGGLQLGQVDDAEDWPRGVDEPDDAALHEDVGVEDVSSRPRQPVGALADDQATAYTFRGSSPLT